MATTCGSGPCLAQTQANVPDRSDRSARRRPFSTWMKKLAKLKNGGGSSNETSSSGGAERSTYQMKSHSKRNGGSKNNKPCPQSANGQAAKGDSLSITNGQSCFSTEPPEQIQSSNSMAVDPIRLSEDGLPPPTIGNKSTAATVSTENAHSDAPGSHAPSSGDATLGTIGAGREGNSTFSSPAPSVRSLATTLTTIHSAAPGVPSSINPYNNQNIQFAHQFPTSPPPSALPPHLMPQTSGGHPQTYTTATANNLLTDNASILTLASSSKRRRRRSMDTDASVRALAPSSLFGGSRESLPLSVLSATVEPSSGIYNPRPSMQLPNERASIYSATGVTPALPSERNSCYAGKTLDGGSMKSGFLGHGRNDSITGSIGGVGSPLASPGGPLGAAGRLTRTNSALGARVDGEGAIMDGDENGAKRNSQDDGKNGINSDIMIARSHIVREKDRTTDSSPVEKM